MWMTLIAHWWREALIGCLCLGLALSISLGRHWLSQRDQARDVIRIREAIAKTYEDESKQTAKETSDAFTALVGQIKEKDRAIAAAKARFGACPVVPAGPVSVLHPTGGTGQTDVPESTGGSQKPERIPVDRAFIDACAADAAFVRAAQDWRMKNNLPVEK